MDENEFEQNKQPKGGGGSPIDTAKNVENTARLTQKATKKASELAARGAGRSKVAADASKLMGKVAAKAGQVADVAAKLGPIIATIGIIIIVLIVIIGLLVFVLTGLGFIMSGIKAIALSFWDACINVAIGSESNIHEEEIVDTLGYLEEMGYDVYGYGFVTQPDALITTTDSDGNKVRELGLNKSSDIYKYVTSYLVSDNYAYTIKNNNRNFKAAFSSVSNFFSGFFGNSSAWGSGMIDIYYEDGGIGKKGKAYEGNSDLLGSALKLFLDTQITVEDGSLKIKNPGLGAQTFKYDLDGWAGRYSMPLEFLLSTHLATMAPDLSYKMATSFDTTVEILLHQTKGSDLKETSIDAKIKTPDNVEIYKSNFKDKVAEWGWNWSQILSISKKDALKLIIELGIKSQTEGMYKCQSPESLKHSTSAETKMTFDDYVKNYCAGTAEYTAESFTKFAEKVIEVAFNTNLTDLGIVGAIPTLDELSFADATKNSDGTRTTFKDCTFTVDGESVSGKITFTWSGFEDLLNSGGDSSSAYGSYAITRESTTSEKQVQANGYTYCHEVTQTELDNGDYTGCCDGCLAYVRDLYSALNETVVDVGKMGKYYTPYIYRVINHWFRNVYFTKSGTEDAYITADGDKVDDVIIGTDYEYEQQTGERWTLYDMVEGKPDEYELYVYFYNESTGEYNLEFEQDSNGYVVCTKVDSGTGQYTLNQDGVTYETDATNGEYILQYKKDDQYFDCSKSPQKFRVGKKAILDNKISSDDGWMAYKPEAQFSQGDWEELPINDSSPTFMANLAELQIAVFYKMQSYKVEQAEDGVRGQTNAKIKELFLDDYYLYDGTGSTAALIQAAKAMVPFGDSDDPDTFREKFGKDKIIKATYEDQEYSAKIGDISGPISLTHSSLAAFSMLENMHTLDAEYIYHDFKELIVELNYFDKEDLTEAETEVMMFPVSGYSANGWPLARYDRSEEYYGTLIHSAKDYEAREAEEQAELAQYGIDVEITDGELFPDSGNGPQLTTSVSTGNFSAEPCTDGSCRSIVTGYGIQFKRFGQGDYPEQLYGWNGSIATSGCGLCSVTSILTGYGYDVNPSIMNDKIEELGISWANSGRWNKIKQLLEEYGITGEWKTTAGAQDIKTILQEAFSEGKPVIVRIGPNSVGPWTSGGGHYFGVIGEDNGTLYTVDSANDNMDRLVNSGGIDALANSIGGACLMIFVPDQAPDGVAKSQVAQFTGYAGSTEEAPEYVISPVTGEVIKYGTTKRRNIETGEEDIVGFIKVRLLGDVESDTSSGTHYFGRKENDPAYGDYLADEDPAGWLTDVYGEKSEDDTPKVRDTIGYDYFWEEYNDAGLGGTVVYIEGFDVADILGETVAGTSENPATTVTEVRDNSIGGINIQKLADYIDLEETENAYSTTYVVPNLLDDTKEFELDVGEQAKQDAVYVYEKDGKIYIKEGAVIGKTYGQEDERVTKKVMLTVLDEEAMQATTGSTTTATDPNVIAPQEVVPTIEKEYSIGNYMRIIYRNKDGEVIENIEDYMDKADGGTSLKAVSQEYKAWAGDLEVLAETMVHESSYSYLASKSNKFASDQEEADFEMYCMGYSVVNKLLEQNKQWYGMYYDETRTDMSPLVQVVTNQKYTWYYSEVAKEALKVHNGGGGCYTAEELKYAEYCLTYDCTSITKPNTSNLSSATIADGYTTTDKGSVIPRAMCQQGGYGDGASGQSGIILVGYWDHNNNDEFDKGDELWGVDRSMEHLIE